MHSKNKKVERRKTVFYLRTDLYAQDLKAGGSVAHTLGVLESFCGFGLRVLCASAAMLDMIQTVDCDEFYILKQPKIFAKLGFRLNCLISNFFFIPRCLFFLRKKKIDFVYQRYGLLNFVGALVAWCKRAPLVLEFNGSEAWIDKHWQDPGRFRISFAIRWIENFNLRYAKHIIVVSGALKDFLVEAGVDEKKILVNPNGVDTKKFDPIVLSDDREKMRRALGLQDKFVFGFIGSFSVWHGIETIAAMIPEVVRRHPHVHFLLIGSGPLLQYLKDELKNAGIEKRFVTLTGTVVQSDAPNYLAACDAFLSPTLANKDGSRFFGSPTKMFEYMSLAKPIIASDLEQLSELLEPAVKLDDLKNKSKMFTREVGILVPPHDIKGFIEAACFLAQTDEKQKKILGDNVRQKTEKKYTWHVHTKKILSFIQKPH